MAVSLVSRSGVATGVGAVRNTARVEPGSSVVVPGCGGVGLSVVEGARLAGAERIVAVELRADRTTIARALGRDRRGGRLRRRYRPGRPGAPARRRRLRLRRDRRTGAERVADRPAVAAVEQLALANALPTPREL